MDSIVATGFIFGGGDVKAYDKLFIGGEWVSPPAGTGTIDVINPTTEEVCRDGPRRL